MPTPMAMARLDSGWIVSSASLAALPGGNGDCKRPARVPHQRQASDWLAGTPIGVPASPIHSSKLRIFTATRTKPRMHKAFLQCFFVHMCRSLYFVEGLIGPPPLGCGPLLLTHSSIAENRLVWPCWGEFRPDPPPQPPCPPLHSCWRISFSGSATPSSPPLRRSLPHRPSPPRRRRPPHRPPPLRPLPDACPFLCPDRAPWPRQCHHTASDARTRSIFHLEVSLPCGMSIGDGTADGGRRPWHFFY